MDHDDEQPTASWGQAPELLIGRRVGEFVIEELLGEGGAGMVYRARQEALARDVVVKVLARRGGPGSVEHFLREAKLASRLDHPYAAHVYAFGAEDDGMLWIAMELVRGTPLRELLDSQGSLPVGRFVPLLEKICEVVYTAHQQGIVHRDIKPSNVMVVARAGQLLPKLLDFGIARLASEPDPDAAGETASTAARTRRRRVTGRGPYTGSPPYMAPEQWVDVASADERSDQYALAVLSYETLTARLPFRASSDMAFALAHATKPVPPLGDGFPAGLDEVLQRALAKKPADRYPDVMQLAAGFRAAGGLDQGPARLPRLEAAARDNAIVRAPQPLADTVAFLDAARTATRARDAALKVVHVSMRLLGLLAVAAVRRMGPGGGDDARAARAALRRLHGQPLSSPEWLALARALVHPFASRLDAHPVPELVLLFFEPGGRARPPGFLDRVSEREFTPAPATGPATGAESGTAPGPASEPELVTELTSVLPELAELLGALSFLGEYPLLVHRGGRTEAWMGVRRPVRPAHAAPLRLELAEGDVVLAAPDGEVVLSLRPLCQLLAPAPGAPEELFLFDGPGRHGATLTAFPVGFERSDPDFWDWYHASLLDDPDEDEATRRADTGEAQAPYLGLSAFSPADAGHYVGREREVEACVNRLRIEPLLAVVGPSGAGKSSFVQAGIIAALPESWRSVTVRPGPAPLAQLAARLEREGMVLGDLRARLREQPDALAQALSAAAAARGETLLLVIDQFEELLTLCLDPEEQRLYSDALMHAARVRENAVRVVITLRDDFLVRAQQLPALRERLALSLQILGTPPPDELVRIVVEPARRAGYSFEDPDLPVEMVNAVAGEPGALALLSFTATKLWELRDRHFRRLRRRAYATLGGVGGALAQHAEETLARMAPAHQALVREVFRQVVTADGTRAVLSRPELRQVLAGGDADEVIEELIRARLLVASEGDTGEQRIELVHEALLSSWPRLVGWQREDAESARLRDQVRAATRQWLERGRSRGLLWRGDALLEYRVWRSRYRGSLTEAEEAFARASLHEEARGRTRRRMILGAVVGILVVGMALMFALERRASRERDRAAAFAAESRQRLVDLYLEQGRQALLDHAPMQSLAYLSEALARGTDDATLRFLLARATRALDGQRLVLAGHEGALWTTRFSPDGARIATGGADGTARIWDARSGALMAELPGHTRGIWSLRFSADGARLVTASYDGTARVWDLTGSALRFTAQHQKAVFWAGFTPDDTMLATASHDHTVKLWDAASGALVRTIAAHDEGLTMAAFTPDGSLLVTGSHDASTRIWEVATGALRATIPGYRGYLHDIAVSPDGTRAIAASTGSVVKIFSLRDGTATTLSGHAKETYRVAFSPDGARALTASDDRTAKVWDAATGTLLMTLEGHASGVTFAGFSPDGKHIVTGGRDGTVRVWDAHDGARRWTFFGHRDSIWQGDIDAAGTSVVTASFDGTARVWALRQRGPAQVLPAQEAQVWEASMNPAATRIATADRNGNIRVWDRQGRMQLDIATDHTEPQIVWSSDGSRLLTSGGHTAVVRDARTGTALLSLRGHEGRTHAAAFAPDQSRVVTAGEDHIAKIWDARTGALLVTLQGHTGQVLFADFDVTGQRVVTTSDDATARVWDGATGALLHTLVGHGTMVASAHFSVDGSRIITAGEDRKAILWSAQGERLATMEGHVDAITEAVISRDGRLAITACYDGTVGFWEAASGTLLWSIDLQPADARSVMLDATGALLLVAAGNTAMLWDITYDDRTKAAIQAFTDCRVDYKLQGSRLVPRERPPVACPER